VNDVYEVVLMNQNDIMLRRPDSSDEVTSISYLKLCVELGGRHMIGDIDSDKYIYTFEGQSLQTMMVLPFIRFTYISKALPSPQHACSRN
jgi:hypothetical protein